MRLSPREKKLAAFALLFALVALIWYGALLPIIDGFADRAEARVDLREQYSRNDHILAGLAGWRMAAKQQSDTEARFSIVAPTRQVGIEIINRRIAQTARAVGGTVVASQEVHSGIPRDWISVRSDMRLTLGQLNAVLTRLQSEEPYVVVDYLSIGTAGNPQSSEPDSLAVRLEVSAHLHIETTPASGANPDHA
ncbi:hypothetical protein FHS83_002295 [Rhizomicrobium palustre]|uniref:General secretion pathway protein GspM n=1 Tax=Rhizomicrobium palustre TaxID=189966 RepID=A0A846N1E3_9PROT|nr:type II secretion system protein GspM [Rhizomicrobium palustre]NIK88977.1 hypothetical protein [Rhizomicrobium palustre]